MVNKNHENGRSAPDADRFSGTVLVRFAGGRADGQTLRMGANPPPFIGLGVSPIAKYERLMGDGQHIEYRYVGDYLDS